MTIMDTLSAGFDRTTRRLWLVLIPALLDVAIWLGPRLSVSSLSQQALAALPSLNGAGPEYQQSLELARDWLNSVGWNHEPPAPELPPEVVAKTSEKYLEAYRRLTGKELLTES